MKMDALAAYGSDDSSAESSASSTDNEASNGTATTGKPALASLLDYSDDGESSDSGSDTKETPFPTKKDNSPVAQRKRKRDWDNSCTDNVLPSPPLSSTTSLIQWDTDYTAHYRTVPSQTLNETRPELIHKLSLLSDGNSVVSWAQHLKSQHEFHNPHFFDNVVSHFGIQKPLDSNLATTQFQLYEYDLLAAEQHARIRQEQERQRSAVVEASTRFAQQHFEQALRKPRGMSM